MCESQVVTSGRAAQPSIKKGGMGRSKAAPSSMQGHAQASLPGNLCQVNLTRLDLHLRLRLRLSCRWGRALAGFRALGGCRALAGFRARRLRAHEARHVGDAEHGVANLAADALHQGARAAAAFCRRGAGLWGCAAALACGRPCRGSGAVGAAAGGLAALLAAPCWRDGDGPGGCVSSRLVVKGHVK